MTIQAPDVIEIITGSGGVLTQSIPFKFQNESDIRVWSITSEDGVTTEVSLDLNADFIITKTRLPERPDYFTGSITTSAEISAQTIIAVMVWPSNEQITDFSAIPYDPADYEKQHDLSALRDQSLLELLKRTPRLPLSFQGDQLLIEQPISGRVLIAREDGLGWENGPTADQIENAQGYAEQAVVAGALMVDGTFETKIDAENSDLTGFISTIRTNGYGQARDGGAATYLRTTSLVKGGFQDQANAYWKPSLDNPIAPETFGAKGGNAAFDDSVGLQNMFDALMENSKNGIGFASLRQGQRYYCKDAADLIVDPGFVGIYGNGARISFDKSSGDPDAGTELVTNNSFASSGTGWTGFSNINGSYSDYTFDGSNAVYEGGNADGGVYAGIYQQVYLEQGRFHRIRTSITSMSFGQPENGSTQQYLAVAVRDQGPDAGATFGKNYGPVNVGEEQVFDFKWTAASGTYWLQIKSNNPVVVADVSLKLLPNNTCIEMAGDYSPFAIQYSPALGTVPWSNFTLDALNNTALWGVGILANTDTAALRSQIDLKGVNLNFFYNGLQTANRAYIGLWEGGGTRGSKNAAVLFGEGDDAGENMRLKDLTLSNQGFGIPGIINKGRYVHLEGCSIDYVGGAFIDMDGGYTHAERCHFEKTGPAAGNYPFIVRTGTLLLDKGYCQLNLIDPTTMDYVFSIGAGGRAVIDKMQAFGWQTTTGELATGDGYIHSRLSGIGQKSVSGFPTKTAKTSLNRLSNDATDGVEDWKYCVQGGTSRVSPKETDYLKAEQLTTGLRTAGQNGVKITRLDGVGLGGVCYLAVPCPTDGMVSQEFYIKVTANGAATGTGNIFIDWRQVALRGDPNGLFALPPVDDGNWWGGEFNVARDVEFAAGQDWTLVSRNGANVTNSDSQGQEFGADWRTHWVLILNLNDLPVGSEVHICDLLTGVL